MSGEIAARERSARDAAVMVDETLGDEAEIAAAAEGIRV
jgi:hypothetical protein